MRRQPPRSTRPDTLFPYTTLFRSPSSASAVEILAISTVSNPSELTAGINYFFAVLPDDATRAVIAAVGERFRKSHRVSGVPDGIDNLHLSLCQIGRAHV